MLDVKAASLDKHQDRQGSRQSFTGSPHPWNFVKRWRTFRSETLGFQKHGTYGRSWPIDCLRHTYGTYWLAHFQDRPRLAELMGNSPYIIRKNYRQAISPTVAEQFWQLTPEEVSSDVEKLNPAPPQAGLI